MEPPPPRHLPPWAKALILMVSVTAIGLGLVAWVRSSAKKAWSEMTERTRARVEEARSRPGSRPVLSGTPQPGNAWDDYQIALKDLEELKDKSSLLALFVSGDPRTDVAAAEQLIASKTETLDHLRRGARRTEANYPYDWNRGFAGGRPLHQASYVLGNLAVAHARQRHAGGRSREAVDLLLDLVQFGSDYRRNATMIGDVIGSSLCALAAHELRDILLSRRLVADDLRELARQLEIVDRGWADTAISIRNESHFVRLELQREDLLFLGGDKFNALKAWRHGFSVRKMIADAVAQIDFYTDWAIRSESLPWVERLRAQEEIRRSAQNSTNFLVKILQPGVARYGTLERSTRARLRMLRAAAHFLASGEFLDLDDPFGTKLRRSEEGGRIRIWSLGLDGVDQNGNGEWKRDGGDIVLEFAK
jgi:hypothetical protein